MQQIEDKQFYTVTNCKLKQYFGKCLTITVNTTVTKAKEQDMSHIGRSSTPVDTILKNHNSGNVTVSGCIKRLGEPVKLEHATKMVKEAELTDPSGTINLSVWHSHMQQIEDKQFYTQCDQLQA